MNDSLLKNKSIKYAPPQNESICHSSEMAEFRFKAWINSWKVTKISSAWNLKETLSLVWTSLFIDAEFVVQLYPYY